MLRPAILTITCPRCGGALDGVTGTDLAQTRPCRYCGTELHVPHVGRQELVIEREIVIEREPTMSLRTRTDARVPLVLTGLAAIVALIAIQVRNAHAHDVILAHAACDQACADRCASATPERDRSLDAETRAMMRQADVVECTAGCSLGSCSLDRLDP